MKPEVFQEIIRAGVVVLRAHDWEREHLPNADPPEKVVVDIFTAMLRAAAEVYL
jgi:hypothetical protein